MIKTPAIVIWTLKYGDYSLIVNCFTKKDGLKGYILKGILKPKKVGIKKAIFQPFNLINIISDHRKTEGLNYMKEASINISLNSIHNSISKTTITLFLSEVLKSVLQEEGGENKNLYNYLETMTLWLDNNSYNSNFHIKFLIELTRYIGFYPNMSNNNCKYFDLLNGCFTNDNNSKYILSGKKLIYFKEILGMNFDQIKLLKWNTSIRNSLLNEIISYYSLHLQRFNTPKSLSVLHEIFK